MKYETFTKVVRITCYKEYIGGEYDLNETTDVHFMKKG